ncbi:phosphoethanolamine transferase [Roseobacter sp. GAI101]|uniref:phosphoethanolamine transferase n=1 Tax=Roseobacter sp. (strain GAI101) TaxID=391589 RepID=UPI0001871F49|nr:phosphoethanolamine--lipid A transferase [Roseobacter sp. GAI101]EEB84535.1 integral membrane protein [Roseobacter sp. GAI101]
MTIFKTLKTQFSALRNTYTLSPLTLILLTVVFVFCVDNATFWSIGSPIFEGHPLSFAGFLLAVYLLTTAAFSLFGFAWTVKPFLMFILILSAVTSYYMDRLGVVIDRDMIQNVMVTTMAESKHLVTVGFVTHVFVLGVLPALGIACVKVTRHSMLKSIAMPVLTFSVSMALATGLLMADLKSYSSILRERKDLMGSYQPGMPLVSTIRYAKLMTRTANLQIAAIGEDATKGPAYSASRKPVLTIVVAGETARAQNFSLNGYDKDTNPRLSQLPVVSFTDVNSCGTATAVSLPCMFSNFTRDDYSYEKGISNQNVLDVFDHAGLHVEWWDNNTGHKGIADRVGSRMMSAADGAAFCASGECTDGVFMHALAEYASTITEDTVLVLHHIGSHGPTYYLRYPAEFERFTPACRTAEFKNCTAAEITNSYDNTIAYTDEILAQTIEFLNAQTQLSTALVYVSDHGESLGEGGLYLHGSPYFMAPEFQTKVPMILWMSQRFQDQFAIDQSCIADQRSGTLSHDNLFHSLLGMMDIKTRERDPELDIFASCKAGLKNVKVADK